MLVLVNSYESARIIGVLIMIPISKDVVYY